jgi:hypothetical protein
MNRKIKFRAWDGTVMHDETELKDFQVGQMLYHDCEIWELMQYSGLKDKSGVEIFEGDIVRHKKGLGIVEYSNAGTRFGARGSKAHYITGKPIAKMWSLLGCKVIGNVYQNPGLLKDIS